MIETNFDLVDANTVEQIARGDFQALPLKSYALNAGKDFVWNKMLVDSAVRKAVANGESIPKTAKSLRDVSESNAVTAKRVVRTAMTNAQNLGRSAGYKKAIDLGIKGKIEWIATMDNRVRHSHAVLDGEKIEVGEKFSNGCRYPADKNGVGSEIYNCRCTTGFVLDGIEDDSNAYRIADNGMSYEEWKTFHSKMLNNSAMFRKKGEPFRGKVNIPSAVINKVTKKIRKKGAEIRTAEGEVLYRMNKEGASAATYGDIIFIRDDGVTISDILEETRHVEQNNSGLNDDKPAKLRILLNEIEAKEFILSCEKNYNIPREEIELTKEQLQSYRRQLDDYYRQNKSD